MENGGKASGHPSRVVNLSSIGVSSQFTRRSNSIKIKLKALGTFPELLPSFSLDSGLPVSQHRFGGFTSLDFSSKEKINRKFGPIPFLDTYIRYGQAKSSNILFAREINKRWDPTLVRALAVHPGVISTDLYKHSVISPFTKYLMIGTKDGALASLKAATDPSIEKEGSW